MMKILSSSSRAANCLMTVFQTEFVCTKQEAPRPVYWPPCYNYTVISFSGTASSPSGYTAPVIQSQPVHVASQALNPKSQKTLKLQQGIGSKDDVQQSNESFLQFVLSEFFLVGHRGDTIPTKVWHRILWPLFGNENPISKKKEEMFWLHPFLK